MESTLLAQEGSKTKLPQVSTQKELETKFMPRHSQVVDTVKTHLTGQIGSKPDFRAWYHCYPFEVDFFELISPQKRKISVGFMLSEHDTTEAQIIIIHNSIRNLKKDLLGDVMIDENSVVPKRDQKGPRKIRPDITIRFQMKPNGIIQPLGGNLGTRNINFAKIDPSFEKEVYMIAHLSGAACRMYNLTRTKEIRMEINAARELKKKQ